MELLLNALVLCILGAVQLGLSNTNVAWIFLWLLNLDSRFAIASVCFLDGYSVSMEWGWSE